MGRTRRLTLVSPGRSSAAYGSGPWVAQAVANDGLMVALAAMLGHAAMLPFKVKLGASRSIALPIRRLPCGKLRAPSTAG